MAVAAVASDPQLCSSPAGRAAGARQRRDRAIPIGATTKKASSRKSASKDLRFERGLKVRKQVLGADHVARAKAAQTGFDADYQRFITETAWGAVWSRPGLDRWTRHLIISAILAALGREHELTLHLRSIRNTGTSEADVREALLHVAVYAGIPAANAAVARAKEIVAAAAEKKRVSRPPAQRRSFPSHPCHSVSYPKTASIQTRTCSLKFSSE